MRRIAASNSRVGNCKADAKTVNGWCRCALVFGVGVLVFPGRRVLG
jgi:hypothetical protein